MDHVCVTTIFRDVSGESLNYLIPQTFTDRVRFVGSLLRYLVLGTGPLTSNVWSSPTFHSLVLMRSQQGAEAVAFARSDDPSLFPAGEFTRPIPEDATSGPECPDIELLAMAVGLTFNPATQPIGGLLSLKSTLLKCDIPPSFTL